MRAPAVATLDFETEAIQKRPLYPPRPVGFSLKRVGEKKSRYYAFGHPEGNNCTFDQAHEVLLDLHRSGEQVLFHNAKFDTDELKTFFGIELPWDRIHDTMFAIFLEDPHASTFALKPSAERLLGLPSTERDELNDWLVQHQPVAGTRITSKNAGAYISYAPGGIVGKYADGDVTRTERIFKMLWPKLHAADMLAAYDRERKLMPILLRNEEEGVQMDVKALRADLATYQQAINDADAWLAKRLKSKDLNMDSNDEVADALERAGIVTEFKTTDTGKRSVAKKNITEDMFSDRKVFQALGYRNRLATCLGTFMGPWLAMAEEGDGRINTNWNQVRQSSSGDNSRGTRTGRLSSNPNLQNIPKGFGTGKDADFVHPAFLKVPELPLMRRYVLPDKGGVFCHRDYNQQELRILAHFENDKLMQAYIDDPELDVHTFVQEQIESVAGLHMEREAVKVLNFGMVYGMGLQKLADGIQCEVEDARKIKTAQRQALPGLDALNRTLKDYGKQDMPIRTWGGRLYYCEAPKIINGKKQTFEYKLLNYLIQGSAADCTKEAIIRYDEMKKEGRFLATVHDEINISAPKAAVKSEMAILREAMESVAFDVHMKSDGKIGKNWSDLTKFKD